MRADGVFGARWGWEVSGNGSGRCIFVGVRGANIGVLLACPPRLLTAGGIAQECNGMCEYAIYTKALIKRQQGQVAESLQLFQQAACLNPHNVANLKQVGRSLYLLGKHKSAIDVYGAARLSSPAGWRTRLGSDSNSGGMSHPGRGCCLQLRPRKSRRRTGKSGTTRRKRAPGNPLAHHCELRSVAPDKQSTGQLPLVPSRINVLSVEASARS